MLAIQKNCVTIHLTTSTTFKCKRCIYPQTLHIIQGGVNMLKKIRPVREDINYEPLIYNECDENELLEEFESEAIDYYYDEMLGDYDEDDKNEVNDGYDF